MVRVQVDDDFENSSFDQLRIVCEGVVVLHRHVLAGSL
jgi:hypothetical protein